MDVATMYLSRQDLEQIAQSVVEQYKQHCVPQWHLCYNVDPTELANLSGYKVEYSYLTRDGSILGQTATVPLWTTIMDPALEEGQWRPLSEEEIRAILRSADMM